MAQRGLVWFYVGQRERAIADYDEAIRLDPKYAWAFYLRGNARTSGADDEKTLSDYNEAIRLDPELAGTFHMRALLWSERDEREKALDDFSEAVRLDPADAICFRLRGDIWTHKNDVDKALADYSEAIRLNSNDCFALQNRARAWRAKKEVPKALADLDESIRIFPDNAPASPTGASFGSTSKITREPSQTLTGRSTSTQKVRVRLLAAASRASRRMSMMRHWATITRQSALVGQTLGC